jgi:glycosyltransferase involved in cell wall biosynthesis
MAANVSILVPTYNVGPFIHERMATIAAQTYRNFRVIVYDSGSTDGTYEAIEKAGEAMEISLHQGPREGPYAAWNYLIGQAKTEYVYIATADDTMHADLLTLAVAALDEYKEIGVCSFHIDLIDENSVVLPDVWRNHAPIAFYSAYLDRRHIRPGLTEFYSHLLLGMPYLSVTGLLFRRCIFDQVGGYRCDLGGVADRNWMMRCCLQTDFLWIPHKLATWRQHRAQVTSSVNRSESATNADRSDRELWGQYGKEIRARLKGAISPQEIVARTPRFLLARREIALADRRADKIRKAARLALECPGSCLAEVAFRAADRRYVAERKQTFAGEVLASMNLPMPYVV